MDVVTHGMSGFVLAAPLLPTQPAAAGTFMLAAVAPDLDALSRLFGKRAFLAAHQTWSHALPVIWGLALALLLAGAPSSVCLALAAGMTLHVLLDWTNTYGITLWAPFSRRRFSADAVFFIDASVVALSVVASALCAWLWPAPPWTATAYAILLAAYIAWKFVLRRRALTRCDGAPSSLLPSALVPWRWFGCRRDGDTVHLFRVNGTVTEDGTVPVVDDAALRDVPEFRIMRELSPLFHATERDGDTVTCRDLRTRNFGARFGTLTLRLEPDGPRVIKFEV
ncbi:MAG: metal-dependent hydrolase [Planctomycetota bacterium]|jgi:membrane-bound metal-dependent hydrolase YbcI (DUF457 family)